MQSRGQTKRSTPKKIDRRDQDNESVKLNAQKMLFNKKIAFQSSGPVELSKAHESCNQTVTLSRTTSVGTCQNVLPFSKHPQELEFCKKHFDPMATAIQYLFRHQSRLGLIIGELASNFNDFVNNSWKSKEQQILIGNTYDNLTCTTSRTTKSGNEYPSDGIYTSNFSTLLAEIGLITEEANIKLQQYENFLQGIEHKSLGILNESEIQKSGQKQVNKALFQSSSKKAADLFSEYLHTPSENMTTAAQPTQHMNNVSPSKDSEEFFKDVDERREQIPSSDKGPKQAFPSEKDIIAQQNSQFNFRALKVAISELNSAATSRRSSQNKIVIPTSPQDARKKRPVLHLNLPVRSPKNLTESLAEKTESYLAHNLQVASCNSKTQRDTVLSAVRQKIIETNRNKKADLDLVISKIHDESKLLKGSQTMREKASEKTRHVQHLNLNETSANLKNATGVNPMSPSSVDGMKSFNNLTLTSGQKFEYSIQKLAMRPDNIVLQKKELSETSLRCTEESSQVSIVSHQVKVQDQAAHKAALLSIARDEKSEIKRIMKAQYDGDPSYLKADHGKILQRKYLINAKWWRSWKEFVNFDAKESSDRSKPQIFESHIYKRPGTINNCDLLNEETLKDPKALEFDLDLKLNLLEHHDFEAVSKQVFELLHTWYGCDYEIYRVLKPDPFHDNKLYLDLYPKTKYKRKEFAKSVTPVRAKPEDRQSGTGRKNGL